MSTELFIDALPNKVVLATCSYFNLNLLKSNQIKILFLSHTSHILSTQPPRAASGYGIGQGRCQNSSTIAEGSSALNSLKRSATKMSGVPGGISCVCYPACRHSQAFLILEIISVGLFLLSFILAYNSWSHLEKYGSLLAWMDGPMFSGIQRQRSASSNQSSLCKVYWYEHTVMSSKEWSKFLKPLLKKRFIKAISCSKAHTPSAESHTAFLSRRDSITTNHPDQSCKRAPGSQIATVPAENRAAEHWASKECKAVREENRRQAEGELPSEIKGGPCQPASSSKRRGGFLQSSPCWSRAAWR